MFRRAEQDCFDPSILSEDAMDCYANRTAGLMGLAAAFGIVTAAVAVAN